MQIRVSPDVLRDVANQQRSLLNSIEEEAESIMNLREQLSDAWDGAAGVQACNSLGEIYNIIKNVSSGTEDNINKLTSIADVFDSIDNGDFIRAIKMFPTGLIPRIPMPAFVLSFPGRVRIDPDQVRDIAERCRTVANTISDNRNAFSNTVNDLANTWEGNSYLKYQAESNEILDAFSKIIEAIDECAVKIITAANRYEEIDNSF